MSTMKIFFAFMFSVLLLACESDPLAVDRRSTNEVFGRDDGLRAIAMKDSARHLRPGAQVELLPPREALTVAFSFKAEEGTNAELLLGGKYPLRLPSMEIPNADTTNTTLSPSPGVWQDVELSYLGGGNGTPPLVLAAYLNGNLVHYQLPLDEPGEKAVGPLRLRVNAGGLQLDDIKGSERAGQGSRLGSTGEVILNLPLLRYAYYEIEGNPKDVTDLNERTPTKEGYIGRMDINSIRDKNSGYAVRFTGDLEIPRGGEYTFIMFSPARTRLYIDDELAVEMADRAVIEDGPVTLSEGSHKFRLDHYQNTGWNRLNLSYSTSDGHTGSLNDLPPGTPVALPPNRDAVTVDMDGRPYLLRSFLNFPPARVYDFTRKRTHVVNVGDPDGSHYSYDLSRGSLLMAWRGSFVDVSQMWVNRGEPQTARPLGNPITFDGAAQWTTETDSWPDSLADFEHKRYELDEQGRPTFYFTVEGNEVSDRIEPAGRGLRRTLSNTSDASLLTAVAAARRIEETAPGTFELSGPGANLEITELAAGGLRLLEGEGGQRLVAELPAGERLTYTLNW